jgi:endonuclease/exonuclease/phosphatase family metal-dependent hydrolase
MEAGSAFPDRGRLRVRFGSLNVHQWGDSSSRYSAPQLVSFLREQNVDVIGLQEVDRSLWNASSPKSDVRIGACHTQLRCSNISALSSATGLGYSLTHVPDFIGNSVLSRWPISSEAKTTLTSRTDHKRALVCATVSPPGCPPFRFGTLHLNHETESCRIAQWEQVQDEIRSAATHGTPLLLVGDFNALTREDYSSSEWQAITDIRSKNHWEAPHTALTAAVAEVGLVDLRTYCGKRSASSTVPAELVAGGAMLSCSGDSGSRAREADASSPGSTSPFPRVYGSVSTCRFGTRIDYAFANSAWLAAYDVCSVSHVPTSASDHSLVLVDAIPRYGVRACATSTTLPVQLLLEDSLNPAAATAGADSDTPHSLPDTYCAEKADMGRR